MPTEQANPMLGLAQNKALARQFIEQINARQLDEALTLFAENWVDHAATPEMPSGVEGVKAFFTMLFAAFPDQHTTINEMIAEDDKVVVHLQITGTNKGSFMGMPATGRLATWSVTDIQRIVDGKFVEHWGNSDDLGMMQQLGLIPPPQGR